MDFAFSDEQQLLRSAARAFLDRHVGPAVVRRLWDDARGGARSCGRRWRPWAGWASRCPSPGGQRPRPPRDRDRPGGDGRRPSPARTRDGARRLGRPRGREPGPAGALAAGDRAGDARDRRGAGRRAGLGPAFHATRAEPAGDGVRLTGEKRWVGWAHVADMILVPARVASGLSLYLVEAGAPGLDHQVVPAMDPGTRWATVRLDGVRVPGRALGAAGAAVGLARRAPPSRCGGRLRHDARRGAAVPRHVGRVREGPRAVRPADRVLPGHPPPVRRDAPRGRERPRGDLLCGVDAGRGRRGRRRWPRRWRRRT